MEDESAARDDLTVLLEDSDLAEVRFRELTCKLKTEVSRELTVEPRFKLATRQDVDRPDFFVLVLRLDCDINDGSLLAVEVAARYVIANDQPPRLSHPLLVEFANESGVSDILPFVRQAVYYLTSEVFGNRLMMPAIGRGALRFPVEAES